MDLGIELLAANCRSAIAPSLASRSFTASVFNAATKSCEIFATSSGGMPAGPSKPHHTSVS